MSSEPTVWKVIVCGIDRWCLRTHNFIINVAETEEQRGKSSVWSQMDNNSNTDSGYELMNLQLVYKHFLGIKMYITNGGNINKLYFTIISRSKLIFRRWSKDTKYFQLIFSFLHNVTINIHCSRCCFFLSCLVFTTNCTNS